MIVQKFGGTSMGTAQSIIENVCVIVQKAIREGKAPVVVVSAMSGVTNQLLEAAQCAVNSRVVNQEIIEAIKRRHIEVIKCLKKETAEQAAAVQDITSELEELVNLLRAISVMGELTARTHDTIMAVGEKLSARLFASVLCTQGSPAEYVSLDRVIPHSLPSDSDGYWDEVEHRFRERVASIRSGVTPVLTGFFGQIGSGMLEAVGRGYSDYCASLVGAALKADEIQIWTDVDGVLSANPKVVPEAFVLESVSFSEAAELAHFGAKVLHPFSVRPAVAAGIPLLVLNTFNPEFPGTVVSASGAELPGKPFKSIASKKGVSIVRVTTPLMLMAAGYMAKITRVFARHKISIDLVATSEVSVSLSVEDKLDADSPFLRELEELGDVDVRSQQSIISVVGCEMQSDVGFLGRAFEALSRNNLKIKMVTLGNALLNMSIVVDDKDCDAAVQVLHREFFS